jgi:hypothetical protein
VLGLFAGDLRRRGTLAALITNNGFNRSGGGGQTAGERC